MRAGALAAELAVVLALGACAPGTAGAPETPARRPVHPTLVSLNPCSDAVLAEVADPAQVLAISHYSHDPDSSSMDLATARKYATTSGSLEELLALRPDVVIAGSFVAPQVAGALEAQGIRLLRIPIARSIAESQQQVLAVAEAAGNRNAGIALNARIDVALARAAAPRGQGTVSALVWQSGGIVPGSGTLIADLLARTGFRSYAAAHGLGQADILPLEVVVADPPRVILAAGDARANEDRALHHPALDHLRGSTRAPFERSLLWCGGPTIARAAARLAEVRKSL